MLATCLNEKHTARVSPDSTLHLRRVAETILVYVRDWAPGSLARSRVDLFTQPPPHPFVLGRGEIVGGVIGGQRTARRIVHADLPVVPSPSGLPSQHIVSHAVGSQAIFVGQQWLAPGERVLLHSHPVEEALTFLAGTGEAMLGEDIVQIGGGTSLFIPSGVVHGFTNTGDDTLHVLIVFQGPRFAETTVSER